METVIRALAHHAGTLKRRLYDGGRPGALMRAINRVDARLYASGLLSPRHASTLEVVGRSTGRPVSVPVAIAEHDGERYLVSMLGPQANWVRNVKAAGGHAVLRRGDREKVTLEEMPVGQRAPVLRRYLAVAPGARPHIPVDRRAPLSEFEAIAHRFPVFRIRPLRSAPAETPERKPAQRHTE
ncbi:MAG TPA: nitroreductase family deazaflavin-dependent oxidoreductase [Intrasporangium sp.]|uniref:nitroreductase family deazaflavin-dependent oxidoreductase n=1 Tax=Intrasporangium sp. TaxID=1925024 RepID=UPI002B45FC2C|nr:nitroreductase family deazaflavin-dependent oxidoreductase [Intrasporangium sp.]HKX66493.1 nitroreductase family deazaflavin-dependent oxidoreductase [Intrasporangium sp.]